MVKEACGKNIIPVEKEEEEIWLTCKGIYLTKNLGIYPKKLIWWRWGELNLLLEPLLIKHLLFPI